MQRPASSPFFFFFNDTATTEIYTLSLHDRSSDLTPSLLDIVLIREFPRAPVSWLYRSDSERARRREHGRSEEHTSELQSLAYLVCRLLLEKKKSTESGRCV